MSATYLPHRVAPLRLARDGVRMAGRIPAERFERFSAGVEGVEGEIQVELDFHLDEEQRICLTGNVRGTIRVRCQRCLGGMQLEIASDLNLALVRDEAGMAALPESYDGVLVPREPVALVDLLEDDLILAIPNVPQHDPGACNAPAPAGDGGGKESGTSQKENPFAVLRGWKNRN